MMNDSISRQAAIDAAHRRILEKWELFHEKSLNEQDVRDMLAELPSLQPEHATCYLDSPCEYQNKNIALPSVEAVPKWIPIKVRPMTEEEQLYFEEHVGYQLDDDDAVYFDCEMPRDRQRIWVTTKCGYVFDDVCESDDEYIGLEGNGDWSDITAWMPMFIPEPYKERTDETD